MHAMIALLDDDYDHERKTALALKIQEDSTLTVVSLINKIVALQNVHHGVNGNRTKSSHAKRKNNNDDHDGFKRPNTSGRNGKYTTFQPTNPTCPVCGKRHIGRCTNKQALQRFNANKNSPSNGNTSIQQCARCGKLGHTTENCHKDPKNEAAATAWKAKKQQKNIRTGKPNFNGYKPKINTNNVNNIELNDTNDDVNMTDVVQNTTHIEPDDELLDFDSE